MNARSTCNVCERNPARVNSTVAECSHIQCPHRRTAWSERPTRAELYRGPWPKRERDADPAPLDRAENMPRVRIAGRECVDTGEVVIGRAHIRPAPRELGTEAERLQTALLDPRTAHIPPVWRRVLAPIWRWC